MPQSSKRKSILFRVSSPTRSSRQTTEEDNDNMMESPQNNNSIVVGGARRPAQRRSIVSQVTIPDSEESDVDMNVGSPASTIDQPIDTAVVAKAATKASPGPAAISTAATAPIAEVNGIADDHVDGNAQAIIQPKASFAVPVHPKHAPSNGNTAKNQNPSIEEITMRQLQEDMEAYEMDQNFCASMLDQKDLTPHEIRTIKLRQMDLMHQLRLTRHRLEMLQLKTGPFRGRPAKTGAATTAALSANHPYNTAGPSQTNGDAGSSSLDPAPGAGTNKSKPTKSALKRASLHPADETADGLSDHDGASPPDDSSPHKRLRTAISAPAAPAPSEFGRHNTVTRLGYWSCRLCQSAKYLSAPAPKHPATPCKWPLRDTSKLVGHHTELHLEHTVAERCAELAVALDHNRGPLEYWLGNTKTFDIGDGTVINEIIDELKAARIHPVLRQLNRAAREMKTE